MTRKELAGLIGAVAGVTVLAVVTAPATAAVPVAPPAVSQCAIEVNGVVSRGAEPVVVAARMSEALEGNLTASMEEESGVVVVAAARTDEPTTIRLTLRTTEAAAGEWTLTIKNEAGAECAGKVRVAAGASR